MKNMTAKELRNFIFENYYQQMGLAKNSYYSRTIKEKNLQLFVTKLTEKIPDPRNAKEHYQSFLRKKNTKLSKRSKIITQQPKSLRNPNIIDIKSVNVEHPKTYHKL